MTPGNKNSYNSLKKITVNDKEYNYYSLKEAEKNGLCLLYTSPSPRDATLSRMPSSA